MTDEFYLSLAKGLRKHDRGHIQYAQASGTPEEWRGSGPGRDMDFAGQLAAGQ